MSDSWAPRLFALVWDLEWGAASGAKTPRMQHARGKVASNHATTHRDINRPHLSPKPCTIKLRVINRDTIYIYIYTPPPGLGLKNMAGVCHFSVNMHHIYNSINIQTSVFWVSLNIHQEMIYTSRFLIFSRPKPGGSVYIWCP